jgi:hypothetical protein
MSSSILTSLAYCIMWWSGDVRDYWLVLTILQIFAVFLNCYCFVVIAVFYKRMQTELKYYEGKRAMEYDRFSQRGTPQTEIDEWDDDRRWPPPRPAYPNVTDYNLPPYGPKPQPPYYPEKLPLDRLGDDPLDNPPTLDPRPHSALPHAQSVPTVFDDFRDVPRQHQRRSHRHRSNCRHCDRHHHHRSHSRSHRRKKRREDADMCSECSGTESTSSHHHNHRHRSRRHLYSDNESDLTSDADHRHKRREQKRGPRQVKRDDRDRDQKSAAIQANPDEIASSGELPPSPVNPFGAQGITIPQHIVIPPTSLSDSDGNVQPRKYQINSEITISYDPRQQGGVVGDSSSLNVSGAYPSSPPLSDRHSTTQRNPMSVMSNV